MIKKQEIRKKDLIYPELSYQIVGVLFSTYNELGGGLQEKYYQRALAANLKLAGLKFKEQAIVPLEVKGGSIGNYRLDFLIEDKVILEIKKGENFKRNNINQVIGYLKSTGLKLAIIANFTSRNLEYRRIVNTA